MATTTATFVVAVVLLACAAAPTVSGRHAGPAAEADGAACATGSYRVAAETEPVAGAGAKQEEEKASGGGKCLPCPDCSDIVGGGFAGVEGNATATAAASGSTTTAVSAEEAARFQICTRQPECSGRDGSAVATGRLKLVRDMSALEPVGLGTAAGVVGGLCLVALAIYLGRRFRGAGRKSASPSPSPSADAAAVIAASERAALNSATA